MVSIHGQDIADSLQTGLMKLWESLIETSDLLADKDLTQAVSFDFGGSSPISRGVKISAAEI